MREVYLDSDYMCHLENKSGFMVISTDVLDGYSEVAIENIRFIPQGRIWIHPNGRIYRGQLIQVQNSAVDVAVRKQSSIDNENMMALDDVAELVEMVYQDDLGVIG